MTPPHHQSSNIKRFQGISYHEGREIVASRLSSLCLPIVWLAVRLGVDRARLDSIEPIVYQVRVLICERDAFDSTKQIQYLIQCGEVAFENTHRLHHKLPIFATKMQLFTQ